MERLLAVTKQNEAKMKLLQKEVSQPAHTLALSLYD